MASAISRAISSRLSEMINHFEMRMIVKGANSSLSGEDNPKSLAVTGERVSV
jgi:hypothetical protein